MPLGCASINAVAIHAWRAGLALGVVLAICRLPAALGQDTPPLAPLSLPPNQGEANTGIGEQAKFPPPPPGIAEAGGVCPECGQPYQPGDAQPPAPRVMPLIGNLFLHPPWDLSGGPMDPIWRESWLYRPYSVGLFVGDAPGSELRHDWIRMGQGVNFGIRAGWDWSHYSGAETRFSWSTGSLYDEALAQEIRAQDLLRGLAEQQPDNRSTLFSFLGRSICSIIPGAITAGGRIS